MNDEKSDNDQDELITLSARGITTYYSFPPHITHCPKPTCLERFETRLIAKNHYIAEHASEAIFCSLCSKPITVNLLHPDAFVKHFQKMHPFNKIPFDFDDKNTSTSEIQVQ